MSLEDLKQVYKAMLDLYKEDPELTEIAVTFQIKKPKAEKKTGKINVKLF